MQHIINKQWLTLVLIITGIQLSACTEPKSKPVKIEPAHVEDIEGSELRRITMSTKAMERLDIKTEQVSEKQTIKSPDTMRKVVPYGALIYDPRGGTWVYTSPEPQVFVRHSIVVDYIEGDLVVLNEGPPVGTAVATVGVAELYGTETGMGH